MNKEHRGILIGMALGDGYIGKQSYDSKSCYLGFHHNIKQKEYIEHKVKLIHNIFGGKIPNIREAHYNGYISLKSQKTDSYFRILRKWMYKADKKTITRQILDWLTPHGIAIWYMDDGNLCFQRHKGVISTRRGRLCTFEDYEQNLLVKDWLYEKYDIHCSIQKATGKLGQTYYYLRFNSRNIRKLIDIIEPYIIPSMHYKIDLQDPIETPDPKTLIGELITRIRERSGWTQQQVANYVGVKSWQTVSLWENGHRLPGKASLEEIYRLGQEYMITLKEQS